VPFVARPGTAAARAIGKALAEFLAPSSHRLVGDDDAALSQKQFNVLQTEAEHMIRPYRVADDLREEPMAVAGSGGDFMPLVSAAHEQPTRAGYRDNADKCITPKLTQSVGQFIARRLATIG